MLIFYAFLTRYNISTYVHIKKGSKGRIFYLIYLPHASVNINRPIILPHIHPDMAYKFPPQRGALDNA